MGDDERREAIAVTESADWLSIGAAAKELGVSVRALYRLVNNGILPGYRFGRVIRIKRVDVAAFIEANRDSDGPADHDS